MYEWSCTATKPQIKNSSVLKHMMNANEDPSYFLWKHYNQLLLWPMETLCFVWDINIWIEQLEVKSSIRWMWGKCWHSFLQSTHNKHTGALLVYLRKANSHCVYWPPLHNRVNHMSVQTHSHIISQMLKPPTLFSILNFYSSLLIEDWTNFLQMRKYFQPRVSVWSNSVKLGGGAKQCIFPQTPVQPTTALSIYSYLLKTQFVTS